jgi:hypothetical protein
VKSAATTQAAVAEPGAPAPADKPKPLAETQVAAVEPKAPVEPPPPVGPKIPPEPAMPEGQPDLQGRISGAKGLDEIEVTGRWVKIYGIVDNARGSEEAKHVQALLGYLRPARNILVCYRKPADTHRCYANGRDIAQLALLDGLVRLAPNAPSEYRTLLAQKR